MERLIRADVLKMLHRINELTDRVLLLEGELTAMKSKPVKRAPVKKKA